MSKQTKYPKVEILGVEVDRVSIAEAVDHITDISSQLRQAVYVVKPYVEFFDQELKDSEFRMALNQAYLCLPDGVALKWAAHYLNRNKRSFIDVAITGLSLITHPHKTQTVIKDHFGGTNFTWPLLKTCAKKGCTVFLIGSPKDNPIEHTAQYLSQQIPSLKIVGHQPGRDRDTQRYSSALEKELLNRLRELRPDIILFGINYQAYVPLMARLCQQLSHGVLIGEGGTFDYQIFGGSKKKSPQFIQNMGLEWLWRLALEPSRVLRQLAIPRFIWRIYKSSNQ